ncbi:MAG TPA: bifunctional GNAT family N-acetyltransferase/carbon-nitrogen hydrolase family protein [Bacteroidia bacterium]|jgi:predicted amidohydrolase|nr:bifunctional GNAT family N-acetyltransferase/carbon-nitrogen hydrolase family protein [Bacteroidia bacterium]
MQRTIRRGARKPGTEKDIRKVEIRHLVLSDYMGLRDSMVEAYKSWHGSVWTEENIQQLLEIFPEGQVVVLVNGKVVGCALSIIVNYASYGDDHTYQQITGNYTFGTHRKDGDTLYGIEVFIHPDFRGLRLARRLYDARKELCEKLNLKAIVFGGRIPNYAEHSGLMTPKEYINKVKMKEIYDPVLTFQLSNEFHVKKLLVNYMPGDQESKEYATLMEWNNVLYVEHPKTLQHRKTIVRAGLIQWEMRPFSDLNSLCEQIEFFIDSVSGYNADFALFPELFNAPLMADFNHQSEAEAIRSLAEFTEPLRDRFIDYAITYNVNIITGSMPFIKDGMLYNVGYLCRRDGSIERYSKIHVTPNEVSAWGIVGGNRVKVFDTDAGKIGILVCYDVEFPELSRLLALEGMEILFVPFLTDTQNSFTRVRACAMARAIENECYVAIAGGVGNLPKVHNMDIQFAQSAVFTPADFSFPTNGIKAEATPNTETVLIADLDLDLLKKLRSSGSVRNLQDRRTDIYELKKLKPNGRLEMLQKYADNKPVLHFLNPIILSDTPIADYGHHGKNGSPTH